MKKTIYSICMVIFEITLPLFLIMGAWVSCVCAFSGFIMSYTKEKKKGEKKAEEE